MIHLYDWDTFVTFYLHFKTSEGKLPGASVALKPEERRRDSAEFEGVILRDKKLKTHPEEVGKAEVSKQETDGTMDLNKDKTSSPEQKNEIVITSFFRWKYSMNLL